MADGISSGCIGGKGSSNPRIPDHCNTRNNSLWRVPGDSEEKERIKSTDVEKRTKALLPFFFIFKKNILFSGSGVGLVLL